ncbi:ABC transporter substrate-binding protein [Haladaptatus sp. GCM10025707]|uniref:ABC transporter substrate-binding protein n=1 Tax=Haladaptatus sp. GCM10025707 TaxID=3252658 RepID=UPI0036076CBA
MESRPVIDRSRVSGETSAARHTSVTKSRREGGVYELDTSLLESCRPDLILSQSVCGVCAVDEAFVRDTLGETSSEVLGLNARTLDDVFECVMQVGEATGRNKRAKAVVDHCRQRLAEIANPVPESRPRAAVIEWMDPLHVSANWVPDIVAAAGGAYGLAESGERSVSLDWSRLREYDPAVLIVSPCGMDPDETRAHLSELTTRSGWDEFTAVRTDRVHVLDGTILNRWTPRLVELAETVSNLLHPTPS